MPDDRDSASRLRDTVQAKRRTGRTTRMIDRARELMSKGRAVYIIAANESHADAIAELLGEDAMNIKVETPGSLPTFDWQSMTLRGAHPNCAVLVDHYAIECEFAAVFREWMRYDHE
jgi:hypothetical protein